MAHFAELDDNNIVLRVIVVDNKDTLDESGQESESVGAGGSGIVIIRYRK